VSLQAWAAIPLNASSDFDGSGKPFNAAGIASSGSSQRANLPGEPLNAPDGPLQQASDKPDNSCSLNGCFGQLDPVNSPGIQFVAFANPLASDSGPGSDADNARPLFFRRSGDAGFNMPTGIVWLDDKAPSSVSGPAGESRSVYGVETLAPDWIEPPWRIAGWGNPRWRGHFLFRHGRLGSRR
jgi:hypothetical protein